MDTVSDSEIVEARRRNQELLELYIEDITVFQRLSPATIRAYVPDAKRAVEIFSAIGITFDKIDVPHLKHFQIEVERLSERPNGLSMGRYKGIYSQLNSIMEFLVYNNLADVNRVPGYRKRYLSQYKNKQNVSTDKQVPTDQKLAKMIYSIPDVQRRAMNLLLAKTGIRREQVCLLDLEDVDLVENSILLKYTRKLSNRRLPFDKECADALELYFRSLPSFRRDEGEKALFTNRSGRRLGRNTASRWVNQEAAKWGLHDYSEDRLNQHTKFGPHNYRHWFTTALRKRGCPERIIRYLRGDADDSTADRYDRVTWEEVVEAYLKYMPSFHTSLGSDRENGTYW